MTKNNFNFLFCFFTCCFIIASVDGFKAQEYLTPLKVNPVLAGKVFNKNSSTTQLPANSKSTVQFKSTDIYPKTPRQLKVDTLQLPFLDDFSNAYCFPDSTKWLDRRVFINSTYPIAPPTIGVATFDGLDSTGFPYNFVPGANLAGDADHLTSFPINLYNYRGGSGNGPWITYSALDSVYFSFFYQAGGHGSPPSPIDSIVLEFRRCFADTIFTSDSTYNVVDTCLWQWQWSKAGYSPQFPDTGFHPVILKVDPMYFQADFQFRFRSYAHLNGDLDQWHIDYVYLNKNRNYRDTIFSDVAFAYNSSSLLRNYQEMPWEQYIPSELCDSLASDSANTLRNSIRNNDTIQKNTFYSYQLLDEAGNQLGTYGPYSINIDPFGKSGYCNYAPFVKPPLTYRIPTLTDSAVFIWKNTIQTIPDFDRYNDTVVHYQRFKNDFAYDDGSAERGYYLSGNQPSLAMDFKLNFADTLRAIQIYFNPIVDNAQLFFFRLGVWADNNGMPGKLIYQDSVVTPVYADTITGGFNKFTTYQLTNPALVLPAGIFYVGWMQLSNDPLNVGFDRNTNADGHTFINVSGYWQPSILPGTVMLRPLFRGPYIPPTGIAPVAPRSLQGVSLFPNPTQNQVQVLVSNSNAAADQMQIEVLDLLGRRLDYQMGKSPINIDLSGIAPGIYCVKVTDVVTQQTSVERVIKY